MRYIYVILASFIFFACSKSEKESEYNVNEWIYKQMSIYYLWSEEMPKSPNYSLDPKTFFESLLYKKDQLNGDRFSVILENYSDLLNILSGVISKDIGFEILLYRVNENTEEIVGQVCFVKPNTPASKANIKRGDIFTHIDGQALSVSNYSKLLNDERIRLTFSFINSEGKKEEKTISKALNYKENPILLDTIYSIENSKTGYLVYNFFAPDSDGSNAYDLQLNEIFGKFHSQGISNLILDLRYNQGGYITSAAHLTSAIVKNLNSKNVCVNYKYNKVLEKELGNSPLNFTTKIGNVAINNIGRLIPKLYVLTSNQSASASELLINSLRPFMEVVIVGDVTAGKDVGSYSIYEKNDSHNTWGMQPIVLKYFNSKMESVPVTGFTPNVLIQDYDLNKYELGDTEELLLSNALSLIYPASSKPAKMQVFTSTNKGVPIFLQKPRSGLIMDKFDLNN